MSDLDLCYRPGHVAIKQFKSGALSPVDILNTQIDRAEAVNPAVNAFTDTYYDEAMDQAIAAEKIYSTRPDQARPLEGLTLAVKDSQNLAGKRSTLGSLIYKDNIAVNTAAAVQRLIDAGAIVIGKTTVPEFSSAGVTYSKLFGTTGTPWNPHYTSGGSSGGSAAALGAGMTTLATGSDIAGSIRVPAACCGVVGYKPPYGRIPGSTPFNLDFYCQTGPLAQNVGDCALMANVMSGVHPDDIATLREDIHLPATWESIKGWRIAYSTDLGISPIAPEVRDAVLETVEKLRSLGAIVEEVDLGWTPDVTAAAAAYLDHLFGRGLARNYEQYGDMLCDYNVFYAKRAGASDAETFLSTFEMAAKMYSDIAPMLDKYHAFICPTVATHEVRADAKPWETMTVDGVEITTDYDWVLSHPFNMLSRLPVLSVPTGMSANGLPTSIQIIARSFDDHRVFQLASALEEISPWLDCRERRPVIS
jgi:Asp-tRNA(Asn)/Glu-tRNA(Gln) amidotransferase A subunit family amidase